MASEKNVKEIVSRDTRAVVDDIKSYYNIGQSSKTGRDVFEDRPTYSLKQVLQMMRADSVAWGGITTLLDKVMEEGWSVNDSETGKPLPATKVLLKGKNFDAWLRNIVLHYIIFQNAFGEIVYTPKKASIKELHTLDPTTTRIETNVHNKPTLYWQDVSGAAKSWEEEPSWQPEEIIHVADANIEISNWGEVSTRSIYEAVLIKFHVKKFMLWLFETNQFRGIYNPKSADPQAVKEFITYMKESERNIKKPIIAVGEFEYIEIRSFKDVNTLNAIIYKMDEEILNLLQVPPIYAGLPDNSNRSNSDAQERALTTRVKSIQKSVTQGVNELLGRMNIFKSNFNFNPSSRKDIREILEFAEIMKNMSIKTEHISDFLRKEGIDLPVGDVFQEPMEMFGGGDEERSTTGQAQGAPSRKGKGVGQANKKIGTGERGTTRPEQVSRAILKNYDFIGEPDAI